jgi:hypothetical protein
MKNIDLNNVLISFDHISAYQALRKIFDLIGLDAINNAIIDIEADIYIENHKNKPSAYDLWIENARNSGY